MNILQINKFYFDRGGAERYMFSLSALLERNGHKVIPFSCLYPQTKPTPWDKFFPSAIETEKVRFAGTGLKTAARVVWSREAAHMLDALLTAHRVDVAHLHNIYHHISPSIFSVLRKHGVPTVMTLHDFHLVSPAYNLTAHGGRCDHARGSKWHQAAVHRCVKNSFAASMLCAAELALHRFLRLYERGVDLFIAPSAFLERTLMEWGFRAPAITVIPNFIDTGNIAPPVGGGTVVFAGRLSEEKGVAEFLTLAESNPHLLFEIAGTGPLAALVQARIRTLPHVAYHGFIDPRTMPAFLAQAGVVVIPSRAPEVFPMAALEAGAARKPVIAFRSGGIPEIVVDGVSGILVPEGDVHAMANAVNAIMTTPAKRQEMGLKAHERARALFSADEHYRRIMDAYQRVIR